MSESIPQTSKAYFGTLAIIHLALCAGQLILIAITIFIVTSTPGNTHPETMPPITALIIGAALSLACFMASRFIYSRLLNRAMQQPELVAKMNGYRTAFIVRCAVLEAPALVCAVLFILTGEYYLLVFAGIILAYFITLRPTRQSAVKGLQLDYTDQQTLENPEAIISVFTRPTRRLNIF